MASEVEEYVKEFSGGSTELDKLMQALIPRIICKNPDLYKAETGCFSPSSDLDGAMYKIADWLALSLRDGEEWLTKQDNRGVPLKFSKFHTLTAVLQEAGRWLMVKGEDGPKIIPPRESGVELVMAFNEGYSIVRLHSLEQVRKVGIELNNCLKGDNPDGEENIRRFVNGDLQYYVLRDHRAQSHALIDIRPGFLFIRPRLYECRGHAHSEEKRKIPSDTYMKYISEFARRLDVELNYCSGMTGLVKGRNGNFYSISDMPENFETKGSLRLWKLEYVKTLPDNLTVNGDLEVGNRIDEKGVCQIWLKKFPKGLKVRGEIQPLNHRLESLIERSQGFAERIKKKTSTGIIID